jgi:hypothetical protein
LFESGEDIKIGAFEHDNRNVNSVKKKKKMFNKRLSAFQVGPASWISQVYATTGCSTRYQTLHFFNSSNTTEDIATKFEQQYVLFFHISYTMR